MKNTRKITCHLLELAESGSTFPRWEDIARECLAYMSEADVEDMARVAGWLPEEEEEEEEAAK